MLCDLSNPVAVHTEYFLCSMIDLSSSYVLYYLRKKLLYALYLSNQFELRH